MTTQLLDKTQPLPMGRAEDTHNKHIMTVSDLNNTNEAQPNEKRNEQLRQIYRNLAKTQENCQSMTEIYKQSKAEVEEFARQNPSLVKISKQKLLSTPEVEAFERQKPQTSSYPYLTILGIGLLCSILFGVYYFLFI